MASLKLVLTDAAGDDLVDHLTIDLYAHQGSAHFQVNTPINGSLEINGVDVSAGPLYRLLISPSNHRVIQAFVSLTEARVAKFAAAVPVDPDQVQGITAPVFAKLSTPASGILEQAEIPFFKDAGGFLQGAPLYAALDRFPLLKACFLNITAKAGTTRLPSNQRVLDCMLGMVRLEQDRLLVKVTPALVEETPHSNAFHSVTAALHEPLPGYQIISSFKTFDRYGNLQLTFQRRGDTGVDYVADIDIDDAQGVEHIFQVLRNSVNGPTNPYDIHDILLQQKPVLDPLYAFKFPTAATIIKG